MLLKEQKNCAESLQNKPEDERSCNAHLEPKPELI